MLSLTKFASTCLATQRTKAFAKWSVGLATCLVAINLTGTAPASAQDYPSRVINLVVPFPAGSATDSEARFLGERVSKILGQQVIIENKAGADGTVAAAGVARAEPDGYTLLLATNSTHAANVHLHKKLPYDPVGDFAPIARLTRNPLVLVVNSDFPAQNLQEFIQHAKQNPGKLTYGSGNTGSLAAAQLIKTMTGIDALNVPYKGTPAAITDILAGRIDFMVTDVAVTREFVETKKLRALGVTTAARIPTMPTVPTVAEAGIPGYQFAAWSGLFAPAGTPPAIVEKLNRAFLEALKGPEADAFFNLVALEPDPSTPEELSKHVQSQIELWGRIIAETGLKKS